MANIRLFQCFNWIIVAAVVAGIFVLTGCGDDPTGPESQISKIAIAPDSVTIEVGEQMEFSIVALTASGDTARVASLDIKWWSSDPAVFTVKGDGTAIGQDNGAAFCLVEVPGRPFVGRDSALVFVR